MQPRNQNKILKKDAKDWADFSERCWSLERRNKESLITTAWLNEVLYSIKRVSLSNCCQFSLLFPTVSDLLFSPDSCTSGTAEGSRYPADHYSRCGVLFYFILFYSLQWNDYNQNTTKLSEAAFAFHNTVLIIIASSEMLF